jgi:hypothetical protein
MIKHIFIHLIYGGLREENEQKPTFTAVTCRQQVLMGIRREKLGGNEQKVGKIHSWNNHGGRGGGVIKG